MIIVFFSTNYYLQFDGYPLFIQIAIIMILLSISLFLTGNAILAVKRMAYTYRNSRIREASNLVSAELTSNIMMTDRVSEHDFNTLVSRLKNLASKNPLYNQVLIDQIIFFHRNFTDNTERVLGRLFAKLNLIQSAIQKVKTGAWQIKAKGLKEMQEMTPKGEMHDLIDPLLNDENDDLRIEAQSAYLRLNSDHPFDFLAHAQQPLLNWHQILLYELVSNSPELSVPDFRKYLKSENLTVISFTLKLIQFYQQLETIPDLMKLITHADENIRIEVISVLGNLDAEIAEEQMVSNYHNETLKVRLKIIEALGEIVSGNHLKFLQNEFLIADDFLITKAIGCALANHPNFNKDTFLDGSNLNENQVTILNHCTNVLIRN